MDKMNQLIKYSNPEIAQKNANKYFGKQTLLYTSTRKDKKYIIKDPDGKWVHFGQMGAEDFTRHKDEKRRNAYLSRATKIKGEWKDNPYSANNMSIKILWSG
jgi:hypothetical protein